MNKKQKELLVAAADLLSSLSSGTLDRAIRHAQDRPGGGYSSTVCVRTSRIKDLHDAVEALWPGLVAKAHVLHVKAEKEWHEKIVLPRMKKQFRETSEHNKTIRNPIRENAERLFHGNRS